MLNTVVVKASPVQIRVRVTATPFGTRPLGIAARRVTTFASGATSTSARAPAVPLKFPEQGEERWPAAEGRTNPGFLPRRASAPPRPLSGAAPSVGGNPAG